MSTYYTLPQISVPSPPGGGEGARRAGEGVSNANPVTHRDLPPLIRPSATFSPGGGRRHGDEPTLQSAAKRRQHVASGVSPRWSAQPEPQAAKRRQQFDNSRSAVAVSRLAIWGRTGSVGLRPRLCAAAASRLTCGPQNVYRNTHTTSSDSPRRESQHDSSS